MLRIFFTDMTMEDKILLAHGSGGKLSHDFIKNILVRILNNPYLDKLEDSAIFSIMVV